MAWVLIMEDDPQVRVLDEEILKEAGHQTLSAANVAEALALLRAYELITVLFADINLEAGGPNGLELAKQAVKILPKLKVLYTTGGRRDGWNTGAVRRWLGIPAQALHAGTAYSGGRVTGSRIRTPAPANYATRVLIRTAPAGRVSCARYRSARGERGRWRRFEVPFFLVLQ
jgi:CheY-like chemotaxis protein